MSNATVCSGRYNTIFARPTGLNQFLLLVFSARVRWRPIKLDEDLAQWNGRVSLHRDQWSPANSQQEDHRGRRMWVGFKDIYIYIYIGDQKSRYTHTCLARAFVESPCVFKKKKSPSLRLVLFFFFFFFFFLNEKKERKIFPLLEIRGSSMEKKKEENERFPLLTKEGKWKWKWRYRGIVEHFEMVSYIFDKTFLASVCYWNSSLLLSGGREENSIPLPYAKMIWIRLHACRVIFIRFD